MKLRDYLGKTRLKLEENLRLIESIAQALAEIFIKEIYNISQKELIAAKAKSLRTKKKFVSSCISDSKQKKRPKKHVLQSQIKPQSYQLQLKKSILPLQNAFVAIK